MSRINPETGAFLTDSAGEHRFLPEQPAETASYDLVVSQEADPGSSDGFKHYLVGGDWEVLQEVVEYYRSKGTPVHDGYLSETQAHADLVRSHQPRS